jgi:hypothetical protein
MEVMSTNDTILVLANGASGIAEITSADSTEFATFQQELTDFAAELAQLVVRDGEGATKFVTVNVQVRVLVLPLICILMIWSLLFRIRVLLHMKTHTRSLPPFQLRHW